MRTTPRALSQPGSSRCGRAADTSRHIDLEPDHQCAQPHRPCHSLARRDEGARPLIRLHHPSRVTTSAQGCALLSTPPACARNPTAPVAAWLVATRARGLHRTRGFIGGRNDLHTGTLVCRDLWERSSASGIKCGIWSILGALVCVRGRDKDSWF